jgi:serine/threonine protein kinase
MRPGTVVASRFEIISRARKGGEGQIFLGRDRATGAQIAIKLLHEEAFSASRFDREVELLTNLSHPGIVQYIGHGALDRRRYLVMEWVQGKTLSQILGHGLTLRESVSVVKRIAEVLGAVHSRGIVHRDIKPSNIMFIDGLLEQVKLLDFGIARPVGPSSMTRTGVVIGTPGFMSPEQARGAWDVDARADVFSLGCVLYTCLCGRPPFASSRMLANLTAILFLDPLPVSVQCPEAPDALVDLLHRMLAKDPARRPADGAAVAEELARFDALVETPRRPLTRSGRRPYQTPPQGQGQGQGQPPADVELQSEPPDDSPPELDENTATTQTFQISSQTRAREASSLFILAALDEERVGTSDSMESEEERTSTWAERVAKLSDVVMASSGMSSLLADGTFVAMFARSRQGSEDLDRAAHCALELRAVIPQAPMVMGIGDELPDVAALERLVDTLVEESLRRIMVRARNKPAGEQIRLGEGLADALAGRFPIKRDDVAQYLVLNWPNA